MSSVTIPELAGLLGVTKEAIRKQVRELFPDLMQHGSTTFLTEAQITEIKGRMRQTTLVASVSTDLEMQQKTLEVMSWLSFKVQNLQNQLTTAQPKISFYDTVAQSTDAIDMAEAAQVLKLGIGRNKLFQFLRNAKVLKKSNEPYQEFVDRGYFEVIEQPVVINGETKIKLKTLVLQSGLDYILRIYNQNLQHITSSNIDRNLVPADSPEGTK